jgi:hypothetical protein
MMHTQAVLMRIRVQNSVVLILAAVFCLSQPNTAISQQSGAPKKDQTTQPSLTKPADRTSASSAGTTKRANLWFPPDIDRVTPQVTEGRTCRLPDVLSGAAKRVEELIRNVDKFTATEVVQHQNVDGSGRLGRPEIRNFNYLVTIARGKSGNMSVEEYRGASSSLAQFPDHIATLGTPALVLIFHPRHVNNFNMTCEGLGQWRGRPAWQVRFEERHNSPTSISRIEIGGRGFGLRLRGRAWILADSYQVARLESDLADEIPQIRLRLQHQDIEYRPVPVPENKSEMWLPSSTELYMDFRGHRFYRQHSFTNLQFFSVKVQQTFGDPKE